MSDQQKPDNTKKSDNMKKVVQLNIERNSPANSQVALARLPAAIHSLRDKARQQLQTYLRELFDKVDDAMFELADRATSNQDQNIFFDSMREVRIRRRAIEASFFRSIDVSFARLLDANAYRENKIEKTDESLEDLSLVKNDELEEMVAVDGMINKANELYSESIQHLTLRIDHLVPIKVYQKNNPLGVDVICHAFSDATQNLQIDVKGKLVLFKLFDNLVMNKLGKLFDVLNQTLIDANILPSLQKAKRPVKKPVAPPENQYGKGLSAQLDLAGQKPSGDASGIRHTYDEQTTQVLSQLRNLLGASRGGDIVQPSGNGNEIATQELVHLLSLAQLKNMTAAGTSLGSAGSTVHTNPINLRRLLADIVQQNKLGSTVINPVDDDVINLVSMMFEFILDDRNLAVPMKALIGRLQIPLVKVAIADKTFFSKGGHPARRLLNEMAMASLGWQESEEENQRKDSLYNKMQEMVNKILAEFDTDIGIFETLLIDFRAYLDREKRRSQILEQRTIDAEDGKAKSERARAIVNAELNRMTHNRDIPLVVAKLLHEAWANVMFIVLLKQGPESDEWKESVLTAQHLIWSVTATMDKDNRQKLLKLVPALLQKLRTGLDSISFSPFEAANLFKQLEVLHLSRLRGDLSLKPDVLKSDAQKPEQENKKVEDVIDTALQGEDQVLEGLVERKSPVITPPEVISSVTVPEKIEVTEKTEVPAPETPKKAVTTFDHSIQTANEEHLALVNNITQGTWFEMLGEGGEKYRCRLAAIIRSVGKYIFVNRAGMKVAEETRETLAIALQSKRLTILDDGMLFDRALESVISNLRDKRSPV
jgi:Protein of unknown function (DUF1631)